MHVNMVYFQYNSLNNDIRTHQINFMDDGFSAEKKFYKKILISLKNGASEEATIFFPKNVFPAIMGRENFFFFFKERNITVT